MEQLNLWGETIKESPKKKEVSHQAKTYTGLYALHKYWGKKPYNVMSNLIEKHTNQGDIVLDPFLGSGVSITEAIFNNRKGLGIDINPSAVFITNQIIEKVDIKDFINEYLKIESELKDKINSFYLVSKDGEQFTGQNYLWEQDKLSEVRYTNGSTKRYSKEPKISDYELVNTFSYDKIPFFYPQTRFFHNSRINAKSDNKIYELFTPRNLTAISILQNRIQQIRNDKTRNLFMFCFTSSIGQASKMVFVIKRRKKTTKNIDEIIEKAEVGSWVIGYWMPKEFFENNVWTTFDTRVKKVLKAKKEQSKSLKNYKQSETFTSLQNGSDYLLVNQPSQKYLAEIPDNSIDYILTDPPHGNRIPYLELSMLWNSWLQKEVNYNDEIIISEAKERNKGIDEYNRLLNQVLEHCYRVLKPEKKLSFIFNSLDDNAWINIINTFYQIGFELIEIETMNYSANSVVQDNRKNGLQTDFVLTYQKRLLEKSEQINLQIIDISTNKEILSTIKLLKQNGLKPFQIMNQIVSDCLRLNKFGSVIKLLRIINNE